MHEMIHPLACVSCIPGDRRKRKKVCILESKLNKLLLLTLDLLEHKIFIRNIEIKKLRNFIIQQGTQTFYYLFKSLKIRFTFLKYLAKITNWSL